MEVSSKDILNIFGCQEFWLWGLGYGVLLHVYFRSPEAPDSLESLPLESLQSLESVKKRLLQKSGECF